MFRLSKLISGNAYGDINREAEPVKMANEKDIEKRGFS